MEDEKKKENRIWTEEKVDRSRQGDESNPFLFWYLIKIKWVKFNQVENKKKEDGDKKTKAREKENRMKEKLRKKLLVGKEGSGKED